MNGSVIVTTALDTVSSLLPSFYGVFGIMAGAVLIGVIALIIRNKQ